MATLFGKQMETAQEKERREALEGLRETADGLALARDKFNNAAEPELVEACVYEINALQARYAYFLRLAREHETTVETALRAPRATYGR